MTERRPFCADLARENGEPLGATASRIDHWFLIEYRGLWTHDAVAGSGLSDQVKDRLREQVRAVRTGACSSSVAPTAGEPRRSSPSPRTRAQGTSDSGASISRATRACGRSTSWTRTAERVEHPLFLICTHGKHDPLLRAVRATALRGPAGRGRGGLGLADDPHRRRPLRRQPRRACREGVYYGRADRIDAAGILDEHLGGRVSLDLYRGRSIYPFAVQAAERAVREATGLTGIHDVVLRRAEQDGESWRVTFLAGGTEHVVDVRAELGDLTFLTCTAPAVKRPVRYVATTRRG